MKGYSQLKSIQIKNLGVIESALLDFKENYTVITGETGAGKTMILTALSLILGGKSDPRLIRAGAERLLVAAEFLIDDSLKARVEDLGAAVEDGLLLITRTVGTDGKNKATIGGIPTTVGLLAELGESLVEIHAQSSSVRLAKENVQRELIDRYAENENFINSYQFELEKYREISVRLAELKKTLKDRDAELVRLQEIVKIVQKFELKEDIYNEIENEISRLEAVEDLNKSVSTALEIVNGEESSALRAMQSSLKELNAAKGLDRDLDLVISEYSDELRSIAGVISELEKYRDNLNADPARFDFLQSRKSELTALAKRLGKGVDRNDSINKIVEEATSANQQIADLSGGEERIKQLEDDRLKNRESLLKAAMKLSESRRFAAAKISSEILEELKSLALPSANIEVVVKSPDSPEDHHFTANGIDQVEINFSSHKSTKLLPLSKSASGGELSRVMLAIEVVLSKGSSIGTYVFDEVDSGVGGKSAIEVGKKLALIAKDCQVLVVTHLPQVAVWAKNHLVVEKNEEGDINESSIFLVEGERRKVEIARLLSGYEDSESAREHAGELLELVDNSTIR